MIIYLLILQNITFLDETFIKEEQILINLIETKATGIYFKV